MNIVDAKIQDAWDFVFTKLVHPATNQIYDFRTSEDDDGAFRHLPTPEEIAACIPNPCGWKSGMEDSDINGGIMLDAAIYRYEAEGDESVKKYIYQLYDGLMLNASVSEQEGFLARAVLPYDGKSHYINPSRDQYTHWIYAMVHFYNSSLSSKAQKDLIREKLVSMAKKAEHDVTAENDYSLLREDGKPAKVCSMIYGGVRWHEALRMQMFYMAAYHVSGDAHWLDMYRSVRDWGLEKSEAIQFGFNNYADVFCLMQMQYSARLIYDYEEDAEYKQRYLTLLNRIAEGSEIYIHEARKRLEGYPNYRTVVSWRECPDEFIHVDGDSYGYKFDYHNVYRASTGYSYELLRNASEGLITQCLAPGYKVKGDQIDAFYDVIDIVDLKNCFNYCPVNFIGAYWSLIHTGNIQR